MADEPEPPNDPPGPQPEPDPPPMPAHELAVVLDRATAASTGCPWEVREAADTIRAWLATLPTTAML